MQQPDHLTDAPENVQRFILLLLLLAPEDKLWRFEDVVHQADDPIVALDALTVLSDAGLILRRGRYVFPTRAATHYRNLFESGR
jgi:hypothetical protein